jgi:hypothetical protein
MTRRRNGEALRAAIADVLWHLEGLNYEHDVCVSHRPLQCYLQHRNLCPRSITAVHISRLESRTGLPCLVCGQEIISFEGSPVELLHFLARGSVEMYYVSVGWAAMLCVSTVTQLHSPV